MTQRTKGLIEQLLTLRVNSHPDDIWLKFKENSLTWKDALSGSYQFANGLIDLGVRPNDRVAIMMGNCPEFLLSYFAISIIGANPVPVNISQRGVTLAHILTDSSATTAIVENDLKDAVLQVQESTPHLKNVIVKDSDKDRRTVDLGTFFNFSSNEPIIEVEEIPEGVGMMYTSGTTGPPKGVVSMKSSANILGPLLQAMDVKPSETLYTPLPLFHGNALFVSVLGSIVLDAKLGLGQKFSASRFWDEVREFEAVEFNTLGGMISILLKQPPSPKDREHNVRVVLSAGCPADRWEEFENRFGVKIVEWFGMVDAPGALINTEGRVGSMGKPVAGCEFKLRDQNDNDLGPNQIGELCFRNPEGQATYYNNNPEATEQAYRGGWFHTGDLAETDEDGFYYYRGRKKESIRRLGENISAWEIETVVNSHPSVLESAAHAVESELGEDEVKLVVVLREDEVIEPTEILNFCEGKMAKYAIPRYVEFVDTLPKTDTHRVQYATLKQRGITDNTFDKVAKRSETV